MLLIAFSIYIALFVTVIYPDDSRIPKLQPVSLKKTNTSRVKISSFFTDAIDFTYTSPIDVYNSHTDSILNSYANHFTRQSARFHNPYQSYIAVGSYPYYLEGRDSILLLSDKKLTLSPKLEGDIDLDLGAVSIFSQAHLEIFHNSRKIHQTDLIAAGTPENSSSFVYKNFIRYLFPNRNIKGGTWANLSLRLHLEKNDTLTFICKTSSEGCFISEMSFWKQTAPTLNAPKNVVFILVDTLRYDAIHSKFAPFLKFFQSKSTSFENAMGAGNMTAISTNSLLSCQMPSKLGNIAFSYGLSAKDQNSYYSSGKTSFANHLQKHGIKTAMIGNISILSEILGIGVNHGFDEQISIEMEGYDTAHITHASMKWLEKNSSNPFFLYIHYNSTHAPYRAPLHDIFATLNGMRSFESQREFLLSLYQAEVRYVDRNLALLYETIKHLGLDQNTTIIINSDHGDAHELRSYFENEAGPPYIGAMFDHVGTLLYNDVLHVPLMISLPGQKVSRKVYETVTSLDIGPTILNLFNIKVPEWCDGLSLLNLNKIKERNVVGAEGHDQRAIYFKNHFKYTKSYGSSEKRITYKTGYLTGQSKIFIKEQLFNLKNDPKETINLAETEPNLLEEAHSIFNSYFGINEWIDIVIDSPKKDDIEIYLRKTECDLLSKENKVSPSETECVLRYSNEKRVVLSFTKIPPTLPKIIIGGNLVKHRYLSMSLPLHLDLSQVPAEEINYDNIPLSLSPNVTVIKTRKDQAMQRKLTVGNTQFEKIFRDWGYLVEEK